MRININRNNLLDIINIKFDVFNPINSFMSKENIISVIESLNLSNNDFFPIPIFFDIDSDCFKIAKKLNFLNIFFNDIKICDLYIESIYELKSKKKLGVKLFNTKDEKHPGFNNFLQSGKFFVQGKVENFNNKILKKLFFSDPQEVISRIKKAGFKNIAGFHTRNVPHKAHEWIHRYALKKCEALMIQPLIGQFKKNEFHEKVIVQSNEELVNKIYRNKKIFLEFLNSYPRYAGPREALFHAITRKNYGCTHFLVGRDHAGVTNAYGQNYYKKYESQKLCKKYKSKLGIEIICFQEPYFCEICKKVVNECNHQKEKKISISGTKIRNLIFSGKKIPDELMCKQISKTLSKSSII